MNGPARPLRKNDDRSSMSSGRRGPSADVYDELDQFVDSEPAAWTDRPRRGALSPGADLYAARPGAGADMAADDDDAEDFAGLGFVADAFAPRNRDTAYRDAPDAEPHSRDPEPVDPEPLDPEPVHPHARDGHEDDDAPHEFDSRTDRAYARGGPLARAGDLPPADRGRGPGDRPREQASHGEVDARPDAGPVRDAGEPAFSRSSPTSARREAFAQRLSAELDRPPPPKPAAPPRPAASRPQPSAAGPAPLIADPAGAAARRAAATPKPAPRQPAPALKEAFRRAPQQLPGRPVTPSAGARPAAPTPPAPTARDTVPAADELDALAQQAIADDEAPADALEWELDNAISAIIQNTQKTGSAEDDAAATPGREDTAAVPPAPAPAPVARDEGAAEAGGTAEMRPGSDPLQPAGAAAEPPRVAIGARRAKPVPSFRFERRPDSDEPEATAPDPDNPLSNIFFQDVREHFDAVHPKSAAFDEDDEDPGVLLPDMGPDGLDEEYHFTSEDEDRLPASLRRAAQRRGPAGRRMAAVVSVVVGCAGLVVIGLIGLNVFAGSSSTGAPPVIKADARDVKVRAVDAGIDAEPDIVERTQLGETEELVLPDRVEIGRAASPITVEPEPQDNELISHRVRTVVVRPDGTIVPSGAARSVGESVPAASPGGITAAPQVDTDADADRGEPAPYEVALADAIARDAATDASPAAGGDTNAFAPTAETPPTEAADALSGDDGEAEGEASAEPAPAVEPTAVRPPRRPTPPVRTARATAPAATAPPEFGNTGAASAPPATAAASPASAPWGVQVSSQRTRADAETSYANLRARYPGILGGVQPMIVAANVGDRGRFFRVRLPANSRAEAASLCQRLKSAGADCFIGRN